MYIDIKMLLIWLVFASLISLFGDKDNFISRFTFIGFFDIVVFLLLSYLKVI